MSKLRRYGLKLLWEVVSSGLTSLATSAASQIGTALGDRAGRKLDPEGYEKETEEEDEAAK